MVYYFSGTGNSTFVATAIANFLGMEIRFIPEMEPSKMEFPEERLVIIFPVYSWGVPPLVSRFISEIPEDKANFIREKGLSVDCVMTCGDEVALAPEMVKKDFKKRGLVLNSIWSVIMPNNYVLLPGFDVDPKELEEQKLKASEGRILEIVNSLSRGEKRVDVTRGNLAWLKSRIVFPLFKRWGIFPKQWHYNTTCIGCGRCARICPLLNVTMENQHPTWGARCCSCLACYHVCPVHAVEYGKETRKKGQYLFPLRKISSRNYHK